MIINRLPLLLIEVKWLDCSNFSHQVVGIVPSDEFIGIVLTGTEAKENGNS